MQKSRCLVFLLVGCCLLMLLSSCYRRPLTRPHGSVQFTEEQLDSITSTLYLYTLETDGTPIDHLCLYEEKDEDRADDFGKLLMDYFITSSYEVTLLYYYESMTTHKTETEQSRCFHITADGRFEEIVIEIE